MCNKYYGTVRRRENELIQAFQERVLNTGMEVDMITEAGILLRYLTTSIASSSASVHSQPVSRWAEEEIIRA